MPIKRGQNVRSGGLSRGALDALTPDVRAKYRDDGLLLDGTVDNFPLELIYPEDYSFDPSMIMKKPPELKIDKHEETKKKEEAQEQAAFTVRIADQQMKEPTVPLSEVQRMIDDALDRRDASRKTETSKTITAKDSVDDIPGFEDFEYKDREYILLDGQKPISYGIRNRHKKASPLQWTNPVTKITHALRYTTNHPSIFEDIQGLAKVTLGYLLMKSGVLRVPKENVKLQKFLHIHPDKDKVWKEKNAAADAKIELAREELVLTAQNLIKKADSLSVTTIAREVCKDFAAEWDIATIRLSVHRLVSANPQKFITLANNPNLKQIGAARQAVEMGYITYADYRFKDENGKIILEVPRNENEYESMGAYLASADGRVLYQYIANK